MSNNCHGPRRYQTALQTSASNLCTGKDDITEVISRHPKPDHITVFSSEVINNWAYKRKHHQNASNEMLLICYEPSWDLLVLPVKSVLMFFSITNKCHRYADPEQHFQYTADCWRKGGKGILRNRKIAVSGILSISHLPCSVRLGSI